MKKILLTCLILCLLPQISSAGKAEDQRLAAVTQRIQENLGQVRPDMPVPTVRLSPMEGFYEVGLGGGQVLYFHEDGKRFFAGELVVIENGDFVNLTETGRNSGRKDTMDAVDEADMLVFSPADGLVKASITVFTDIDCGFCRKQHREVPALNRLGIAVRYMAYPRAGIGSESYDKFVSAWCADDSLVAFTRAKMGQEVPANSCENPVAAQFSLGSEIGVNATPAIVFNDGELHMGYMTAEELAEKLGVL